MLTYPIHTDPVLKQLGGNRQLNGMQLLLVPDSGAEFCCKIDILLFKTENLWIVESLFDTPGLDFKKLKTSKTHRCCVCFYGLFKDNPFRETREGVKKDGTRSLYTTDAFLWVLEQLVF